MTTKFKLRRDVLSDLAVVGVVALALVLGLLLRNATLYRTENFAFDNLGITGTVPAGWVKTFGDDPLISVRNPAAGAFSPVLELRRRPLAEEANVKMVMDALSLERAVTVDAAYKSMDVMTVTVQGAPATQRRFTYVEVNHNPYVDRLPVVVEGIDVALRRDEQVVVLTFMTDSDTFDLYYPYFRAFAEGLKFEVVK